MMTETQINRQRRFVAEWLNRNRHVRQLALAKHFCGDERDWPVDKLGQN